MEMPAKKDADWLLQHVNDMDLVKEADIDKAQTIANRLWFGNEGAKAGLMSEQDIERCRENICCIGMIRSCLVYGDSFLEGRYAPEYIRMLGREHVEKLYAIQKDYIDNHCRIDRNVYTDNDGCTYNSLIEIPEQEAV